MYRYNIIYTHLFHDDLRTADPQRHPATPRTLQRHKRPMQNSKPRVRPSTSLNIHMKLLCFLCKELLTEETMGLEIRNDPIFVGIRFGGIQYRQTHFIWGQVWSKNQVLKIRFSDPGSKMPVPMKGWRGRQERLSEDAGLKEALQQRWPGRAFNFNRKGKRLPLWVSFEQWKAMVERTDNNGPLWSTMVHFTRQTWVAMAIGSPRTSQMVAPSMPLGTPSYT